MMLGQDHSVADAAAFFSDGTTAWQSPDPTSPCSSAPSDGFRSASREDSIPMNHPTPDLQAIQGAYVGNVERLEQHAERLSSHSDVGEELRKLRLEQRRSESWRSSVLKSPTRQFSTSSRTGSVLRSPLDRAPVGPSDSEVLHMSPTSLYSVDSVTRSFVNIRTSGQLSSDMPNNGDATAASPSHSRTSPISGRLRVRNTESTLEPPQEEQEAEAPPDYNQLYDTAVNDVRRNASNASKTTMQQAEDAFTEFDGTHYYEREASSSVPNARISTRSVAEPPFKMRPRGPETPPPGMVFYPAPVPVMLNLPPKLSKQPAAEIVQRSSRMLMEHTKAQDSSSLVSKSPDWLSKEGAKEIGTNRAENSRLPPQLRATLYFDQKPVSHDLQVQGGSAVATLDRLLDASAHAPVSAFTDHPIVGHIGQEVYGSSTDNRKHNGAATRASNRDPSPQLADDLADSEADPGDDVSLLGPRSDEIDTTKPTTLLAELQMRKHRQQSRNKTAANTFPRGMHATLLQMDAVAQVQKTTRKQKHVTLAWEEPPGGNDAGDDEDEDIPLALLGARLTGANNDDNQPLGLLAQRQREDTEPLSARRARLRGKPAHPTSSATADHSEIATPQDDLAPHAAAAEDDADKAEAEAEAGETLAQRRRRLHFQKAIPVTRAVSGDFASEMLGEMGMWAGQGSREQEKTPAVDEEETLAQRRQRLRTEKPAQNLSTNPPNLGYNAQQTINAVSSRESAQMPAREDHRTAMVDRWRQTIR